MKADMIEMALVRYKSMRQTMKGCRISAMHSPSGLLTETLAEGV